MQQATVLADKRLSEAKITDIQTLSSKLKLINFKNITGEKLVPGQEISVRVNESNTRRYTISTTNTALDTFSVIFYLNKNGVGKDWIDNLQKDDCLAFSICEAPIAYDNHSKYHFFFGDETAIGLFNGLKEISWQRDDEYFGVLETGAEGEEALHNLKLMLETVPNTGEPAANAIQWMEQMNPECWKVWQQASFYLAGRASSIKALKSYLKYKGVPDNRFITYAYWADGKTGV